MISELCSFIGDKKILILGFGREGQSTYDFIRRYFPDMEIGISDKRKLDPGSLRNAVLYSDSSYQEDLDKYDIIMKSPGIVLDRPDEMLMRKLTSQAELFLKYYSRQTIGITGTKGKSTTSSLLRHILVHAGRDALLAGNVGLPVFEILEQIRPETRIIFELSSHQLEYIHYSPHIAVYLNLFEEHLDHYGTFEKYARAKENIYRYQKEGDVFIYNSEFVSPSPVPKTDLITVSNHQSGADACIKSGSIFYRENVIQVDAEDTNLKGEHNLYNIGVSYVAAKLCGISNEDFLNAVKTFEPLPHRLEFAGEWNGVKYYNDSISTICETAIQAVKSLKQVQTVILGGMDRGIDYRPLVVFLLASDIETIVLMPDTGYKIRDLMDEMSYGRKHGKNIIMTSGLEQAVQSAANHTEKGRICLFSPAAASYGFFKNFEERGDRFKELLQKVHSAG